MKVIFLIPLVFIVSMSFSQEKYNPQPSNILILGNSYNLRFTSDESEKIVDALFGRYPQVKRKKYSWKFKNVQVPGFEETLSFRVYQGIVGIDTTGIIPNARFLGCYYFCGFQNDSQKELRLEKKLPSEKIAVNIYIKTRKKESLKSRDEIALVESYLKNL